MAELPWILAAAILGAAVLLLAGLLFYFRREVGRIRGEVRRLKDQPAVAAPALQAATGPLGGASRVDLEGPPSDWAAPAGESPVSDAVLPRTAQPEPTPTDHAVEIVMTQAIRVKIISAVGHVMRPSYCACQIRGKPRACFVTEVNNDLLNPTWNHEAEVVDFTPGEALSFSIIDQEPIGEALLPSERFLQKDAEEEELQLIQAPGSAGGSGLSLRVQVTTAVWAPSATPLFRARWTALHPQTQSLALGEFAMRNEWDGEVGFRFRPRTKLVVTALGRQVPVGVLQHTVTVTLWSDETQAELAFVPVGPTSALEGGYAFAPLKQEVVLEAQKEYRISQKCTSGMLDPWFDGCVEPSQLLFGSASQYVEFLGSVYQGGYAFPTLVDRERPQCRRAGMLNLKLLGQDPAAEADKFQRSAGSQLAVPSGSNYMPAEEEEREDLLQIRLVCMSPPPKE